MTFQPANSDFTLNSPIQPIELPRRLLRAGDIEVDFELRRLTCAGEAVALQDIPFRILCLLLEHPGRPVSRRDLQQRFWSHHSWENFERSLNTAIKKLRQAIRDDARQPQLIQTLRANGYRWIGPTPHGTADAPPAMPDAPSAAPAATMRRTARYGLPGLVVVAMGAALAWQMAAPRLAVPQVELRMTGDEAALPQSAQIREKLARLVRANGMTIQWTRQSPATALVSSAVATVENADAAGADVPLTDNPDAAEELLVQIALASARVPAQEGPKLPDDLAHDYAEATAALSRANVEPDPLQRAILQLRRILESAPNHAGAWVALARANAVLALGGDASARAIARSALRSAIDSNPWSAEAVRAFASDLLWLEWDADAAQRWLALAQRVAPQNARVLHDLAWLELFQGRSADALAHMAQSAAQNPLDPDLHANWGWVFYRSGDYEGALRQCSSVLNYPQSRDSATDCVYRSLAMLDRFEQAWVALRQAAPPWLDAPALARLNAMSAQSAYEESLRIEAQWWRGQPNGRYLAATDAAAIGDRDRAMADLKLAVAQREPMALLIGATPEFRGLRERPDFARLLASVRAPQRR